MYLKLLSNLVSVILFKTDVLCHVFTSAFYFLILFIDVSHEDFHDY